MSVNGLSTAASERATPNVSVAKPSELASSAQNVQRSDSQVRQTSAIGQELTKPAPASTVVELGGQVQPKGIEQSADNQESVVNGQGLQAANEQLNKEDQLSQSLQKLADSSNQLAQIQDRKLEFTTSQESGRTIVKVIDKESDDVIRQIPSEEFIRVAEKISDLSDQVSAAQGLLFESKV
jgi:flagellar protein FlaG